jgi:hypothetical protein
MEIIPKKILSLVWRVLKIFWFLSHMLVASGDNCDEKLVPREVFGTQSIIISSSFYSKNCQNFKCCKNESKYKALVILL